MLVELAKVMSKHDGEVCTHLGSDKGLRGGERFEVFAARCEGVGGELEPVEVVQVVSQRLSSVCVLHGYNAICVGDRFGLLTRSHPDQDS